MLSGCAIHNQYEPELHPLDPARFAALNKVELSKKISVINAQASKQDLLLGEAGAHDYYGSLRDITEAAVMHAKDELAKREVDVGADNGADKTLSLKVTSAKMIKGMWVMRAVIDMSVETGDGLTKAYHAENASPMGVERAYNGAAAIAVIEIFSDPEILEYISAAQ